LIWLLCGYSIILSFYKNPCVLPANPEMRIVPGISSRRNYSFYVLLSNFLYAGFLEWFWSTINNNFNDVKHQIKEYKKSPNV
jgi:inner membrane protein